MLTCSRTPSSHRLFQKDVVKHHPIEHSFAAGRFHPLLASGVPRVGAFLRWSHALDLRSGWGSWLRQSGCAIWLWMQEEEVAAEWKQPLEEADALEEKVGVVHRERRCI